MRTLVTVLVAGVVLASCEPPSEGGTAEPSLRRAWQTAREDVTFTNAGDATYDATLKAPACAAVGSRCDSGHLLQGRGNIQNIPELNQPNTVGGSCEDGPGGVSGYGSGPWLERLVVSRSDGTAFAAGKEVTVQAVVKPASYFDQILELYAAPDVSNPTWTLIDSLPAPKGPDAKTLTTTYLLPAGGRQILRGVFRSGSGATPAPPVPCEPSYQAWVTDNDDLVIAVGQETDSTPPVVAITWCAGRPGRCPTGSTPSPPGRMTRPAMSPPRPRSRC